MKSQTERPVKRSDNQRSVRSAKSKGYTKQTARIEARRDGKPLIFGWGGHLSHNEKVRIQRRATWALTGLIAFVLVAVIVGFWINTNIIIPGLPITSVNGHLIPQSQYRKLVAFKAQVQDNQINGTHGIIAQRKDLEKQDLAQSNIINTTQTQINSLNSQIKKLPAGSPKLADLNNQLTAAQKKLAVAQAEHASLQQQINNINQNTLPQAQQNYTQSQVGNDSATWLQDDELIREWLANQSSALQARINPTPDAINRALNAFKADLPSNLSYDKFLSTDGVSNSDMQDVMALKLRRDNMQSYLATLITSPTYQVLARQISLPTMSDAQNVLKQLQHGANFGALAKAKSLDTATASSGGSWGWLARGQLAIQNSQAIVENWIFDPHRKINEMSPIITENGDYHIVQILGIDPSRPIDDATLTSLKNNALSDWLLMIRALPTTNITKVDQNMLLDTANMPPNLPSSAPAPSNGGSPGGLPGGAPGGLPGGGLPSGAPGG